MVERMVKSFNDLVKGLGTSGDAVLQDFQKAVATSSGLLTSSGAMMADASPLQLQNLDNVLTSVLFTEEHFQLFGSLPRVPSLNINYQFDKRLRYGGGRRAAGFVEGGAPVGGTSAWERDSATIRFMGVRRGITHQLMQTGTMGGTQLDPVAEENRNGTLELLEEVERWMFFGSESIKDNSGRTVNYDGILAQMAASEQASTQVIDKGGKPLAFDDLESIAQQFMQRAFVSDFKQMRCLMTPQIIADFSRLRYNMDRRIVQQGVVPPQYAGEPMAGFTTNFGTIPFKPHIFFERVAGDIPLTAKQGADPGSPATPATITPSHATDDLSLSTIGAATYYYSIASFNDSGESLPVITSSVAALATEKITLAVTTVANSTGYRFYRGLKSDGSDHLWVADAPAAATTTTFIDRNEHIPGTGFMLLWLNDPENVVVPQFLPMLRWPVAITTTTVEWFLLLYHTLKIKAPQRFAIFKNVGKLGS